MVAWNDLQDSVDTEVMNDGEWTVIWIEFPLVPLA